MASYKSNFMGIMFIFALLCFQQSTRADINAYRECIAAVQDLCNDQSMDLQKCAQRAIMHWTHDTVNQRYLKDYFKRLREIFEPVDSMQGPEEFCSDKEERCMYDLEKFNKTWRKYNNTRRSNEIHLKSIIVDLAYQSSYFCSQYEGASYLIDYLRHIHNNIQFGDLSTILSPELHCRNFLSSYDSDFDREFDGDSGDNGEDPTLDIILAR